MPGAPWTCHRTSKNFRSLPYMASVFLFNRIPNRKIPNIQTCQLYFYVNFHMYLKNDKRHSYNEYLDHYPAILFNLYIGQSIICIVNKNVKQNILKSAKIPIIHMPMGKWKILWLALHDKFWKRLKWHNKKKSKF